MAAVVWRANSAHADGTGRRAGRMHPPLANSLERLAGLVRRARLGELAAEEEAEGGQTGQGEAEPAGDEQLVHHEKGPGGD